MPARDFERGHRFWRARVEIEAIEKDGVVFREIVPVVGQEGQVVMGDFGIGRIGVGNIDGAGIDAAIGEVVIEALDVLRIEPIGAPEPRPTIAAIEELVGKAVVQLGMLGEVGNAGKIKPLGRIAPDRKGIGVVEPDRLGHADTALAQDRDDFRARGRRLARQKLMGERPGIFGIGVDIAALQRLPEDPRAAQLAPVTDGEALGFEQVARDLAEHHGFGEFLRADDDVLLRRVHALRREKRKNHDDNPDPHDAASGAPIVPALGPDEACGEIVRRASHEVRAGADLLDTALVHQDDGVAEMDRLRHVVGDENDGLGEGAKNVLELVLHLEPDHRIEGAQGLVHQ